MSTPNTCNELNLQTARLLLRLDGNGMKQHLRHRLDALLAHRVLRRDAHRRFVVYGEGRCGSTLLASLLDSHPQVTCADELLHNWKRLPRLRVARETRSAQTPLLGFKLLKYHLAMRQTGLIPQAFLQWLHIHQFKIIYLTRRNLFRQAVSKINGRAKREWHRHSSSDKTGAAPITISPDELLTEMRGTAQADKETRSVLGDLPFLHLVYEDHLEHASLWKGTTETLCEFLDVPYAPLDSALLRFTPPDPSTFIENYPDIVTHLSDSEYARFLNDPVI